MMKVYVFIRFLSMVAVFGFSDRLSPKGFSSVSLSCSSPTLRAGQQMSNWPSVSGAHTVSILLIIKKTRSDLALHDGTRSF